MSEVGLGHWIEAKFAGLVEDKDGWLYGTAEQAGLDGVGVVFLLHP